MSVNSFPNLFNVFLHNFIIVQFNFFFFSTQIKCSFRIYYVHYFFNVVSNISYVHTKSFFFFFFFFQCSDVTYNHLQSSIQIKAQLGVYFMEYGIGLHNACGFN